MRTEPAGLYRPALTRSSLRVLGQADLSEVAQVLSSDPVANVFVASRVESARADFWRLGGELWAHVVDGRIAGVCFAGANLVPASSSASALRMFAERARRQGRRCSSIVGPRQQVAELWRLLEPQWGPAREVRHQQPLLAISGPAQVDPDPFVRRVRDDELGLLLPACIDMFTEEVGVSPLGSDGGSLYRARVRELITSGRSFARIDDGRVVFKAEIGALSSYACQVQGVWVDPELRGTGLAAPAMAAVVAAARATLAPVVSLYVNGYNEPAQRAYQRVGFRSAGEFSTVLF